MTTDPHGDLIVTYRNVVYPWQCDTMGHMNTQFYSAAFDAAAFVLLDLIVPLESLSRRGLGWADVRQLIEYKSEVRAGTPITMRSGIVKVGGRSITSLHTMITSGGTVAATSETVTAHFDLERRKAVELDAELRRAVEALPKIR